MSETKTVKSQSKIVVLLAAGFEEIEALTVVDYCRRVGIEVTTAACGTIEAATDAGPLVTGSHGITVCADTNIEALKARSGGSGALVTTLDAVVVPGGMPGASNVAASKAATELLKAMVQAGRLIAAECASPVVVLAQLGLLAGHRWTCFPGMEADLKRFAGSRWQIRNPGNEHTPLPVVSDGTLLTGNGPGAAAEFTVALITLIAGPDAAQQIKALL
jgi:4-methyl-5(b-hydroxyethyl)-thiazole monophosphate biosynthesis